MMTAVASREVLARQLQKYGCGSAARIERASPELVVAGSAAAEAEIDHEDERDNGGSSEQEALDYADAIGIAAHSKQVRQHQHGVRDEQPPDQLPGPVPVV